MLIGNIDLATGYQQLALMILTSLLLLFFPAQEPSPLSGIVKEWISTQNSGRYEAFVTFIENHYSSELKETIVMDEQVAFFDAFYQDNGRLLPFIYTTVPGMDEMVEFRLLKEGANAIVPANEDIVVLRLKVDPATGKLTEPVRLTLLVCEQRGTYEAQ